jgi:hypothetical protein
MPDVAVTFRTAVLIADCHTDFICKKSSLLPKNETDPTEFLYTVHSIHEFKHVSYAQHSHASHITYLVTEQYLQCPLNK